MPTWACLLALAVLWLSTATSAEARSLRVLSYNIHHSEGRDAVYDLNRIASVIKAANPDLVALQELDQGNTRSGVDVFQLDQLAQLTGMQGFFGKTIDYRGGAYGNGVLVRSDLHVTAVVNRPMPSPAGGEARGLMEVGLSLDGANAVPEFHFFATHFTASNDEASRMAQAAYINSLVAPLNSPALIGGDFNARSSSPVMLRMIEQWSDPTSSTPALPRGSQIDYVLHRRTPWNVAEAGDFIITPTTHVASDHYPYLVVMHLVPEPSAMALVGACAGLVVIMRPPILNGTRCAHDDRPRTPPCAKGIPGGQIACGAGGVLGDGVGSGRCIGRLSCIQRTRCRSNGLGGAWSSPRRP